MSEEREHTTPSAPNPDWKETGVLALIILLEMVLGVLLVGIVAGAPPKSNHAMIIVIFVGSLMCFALIRYFFSGKKVSPEHIYSKLLTVIFAMLSTILASGIFGSAELLEMVGAFLVVLLMFCLTFAFFIYYFEKIVRHPVIGEISDNVSTLLKQAIAQVAQANKILTPAAHLAQKTLILGSSHEEMMNSCFHKYIDDGHAIGIKFMGTTYGAFANDTKSSYGFLSALESHIDACRDISPFDDLQFVCCSESAYLLSARYLFFRLSKKLIKEKRKAIFKVVYPHEECITAALLISSRGAVEQMGLIAPSIGKTDKEFLVKNYSIGIVIKDIVSSPTETAGNTLNRISNYIDGFFNDPAVIETWTITGLSLSIVGMKKGMTTIPSLTIINSGEVHITDSTTLEPILSEIETEMKKI